MSDRIARLATDFTELVNVFCQPPRYHLYCEIVLIVWVIWLLFFRKPKALDKHLTDAERQEMIDEWQPEPLVPAEPPDSKPRYSPLWASRQIDGIVGHNVLVNNQTCINFATFDFLDMIGNPKVIQRCTDAVRKYGVGSCGPRGFYGTIDIHLNLEDRISRMLGVEETVLYSYGFSTLASVIPAYAKSGDVIFADRRVNYALQKGLQASRSDIYYFKHNDIRDLIRLLRDQNLRDRENPKRAKVTRRFVVVESLYVNTGNICPLLDLVDLRKDYKFRLILDESLAFGVLGEQGTGLCDMQNVDRSNVDIILGSLEHACGSIGGFSSGSSYVVDHQRLSSLGYCFSASLPPLLAAGALEVLDWIESSDGNLGLKKLRATARYLNLMISRVPGIMVSGEAFSPVKHISLDRRVFEEDYPDWDRCHDRMLDEIVYFAQKQGILLSRSCHLDDDTSTKALDGSRSSSNGTIRLTISVATSESEIDKLCFVIRRALIECFKSLKGELAGELAAKQKTIRK